MTMNPLAKRALAGLALGIAGLGLSACATGPYGGGYIAAGPWDYDGYYDGYYGPIYDGYWGDDGAFYYRSSGDDHHFHRADTAHVRHDANGQGQFQPIHGSGNPGQGLDMPHFHGGGGHNH